MPQVPSVVITCRAKTFGPDCSGAGCALATGCGIAVVLPAKRIKAVEEASVNLIVIFESRATKVAVTLDLSECDGRLNPSGPNLPNRSQSCCCIWSNRYQQLVTQWVGARPYVGESLALLRATQVSRTQGSGLHLNSLPILTPDMRYGRMQNSYHQISLGSSGRPPPPATKKPYAYE